MKAKTRLAVAFAALALPAAAFAQAAGAADAAQTSEVVRIALILSLMALVPAVLICMTSFIRIIVVLSMIRHAFGMPETPPNQVVKELERGYMLHDRLLRPAKVIVAAPSAK